MDSTRSEGVDGDMTLLTETIHGIVCQVCHKRFSGQVPAQEHLQSEGHLRRVRQESEGCGQWRCEPCRLPCNSYHQLSTHLDSPRHQQTLQRLAIIAEHKALTKYYANGNPHQGVITAGNPHPVETSPETESPQSPNLTTGGACPRAASQQPPGFPASTRETPASDSQLPISPSAEVPLLEMNGQGEVSPECVFFDGNRGHCHVCGIELTSAQHKKQHVEGKQHRKKALAFSSRIAMGGATSLGVGGANFTGGDARFAGGGANFASVGTNLSGSGTLFLGGGANFARDGANAEGGGKPMQGIMMCSICNVPLLGESSIIEHFNGQPHKARKLAFDLEKERQLSAVGGSGIGIGPHQPASLGSASFSGLHGPDSLPGVSAAFPGQIHGGLGFSAPQQAVKQASNVSIQRGTLQCTAMSQAPSNTSIQGWTLQSTAMNQAPSNTSIQGRILQSTAMNQAPSNTSIQGRTMQSTAMSQAPSNTSIQGRTMQSTAMNQAPTNNASIQGQTFQSTAVNQALTNAPIQRTVFHNTAINQASTNASIQGQTLQSRAMNRVPTNAEIQSAGMNQAAANDPNQRVNSQAIAVKQVYNNAPSQGGSLQSTTIKQEYDYAPSQGGSLQNIKQVYSNAPDQGGSLQNTAVKQVYSNAPSQGGSLQNTAVKQVYSNAPMQGESLQSTAIKQEYSEEGTLQSETLNPVPPVQRGAFHTTAMNQVAASAPSLCESPESLKVEWHPRKGGVCEMCDQRFQLVDEVQHHLGSTEHRQREEDVHRSSCQVCGVRYSGPRFAREHLNSRQHQLQVSLSQARAAAAASSNVTLTELFSGLNPSPSRPLSTPQLSLRIPGDREAMEMRKTVQQASSCFLDKPPLTPDNALLDRPLLLPQSTMSVEEKVLNDLGTVERLANASAPLAQMSALNITPSLPGDADPLASSPLPEYVFDGSRGVCNVCQVDFTSKIHAESHLAGSKHQKALLRWQAARAAESAESNTQELANGVRPFVDPSTTQEGAGIAPQGAETGRSQPFRFDGGRGYCLACKIELTSEAHAKQHLSGRKHQTAVEGWVAEIEGGGAYPLYCDVCYKPFTGQMSAAQHFSSDKHKKKVELSAGVAAGQKDPDTGALVLTRDGQVWYVCEVCKCPLNTMEQFRLHVNSPRHNAELEKSRQTRSNRSSPVSSATTTTTATTATTTQATASFSGPVPTEYQYLVTKSTVITTPGAYVPPSGLAQLNNVEPTSTSQNRLWFQPQRKEAFGSSAVGPPTAPACSSGPTATGLLPQEKNSLTATGQHGTTSRIGYTSTGQNGSTSHIGYSSTGQNGTMSRQGYNPTGQSGTTHLGFAPAPQQGVGSGMHPGSPSHSSNSQQQLVGGSRSSSQAEGTRRPPGSQGGTGSHRFGEDLPELMQVLSLGVMPSRGGRGGHGGRSATQVLRPDGDYLYDGEEDEDVRSLPRASASGHYREEERGGEGPGGGLEEDAESSSSTTVSSIHGGGQMSETAGERRARGSAASTHSDNLTVLESDPGSITASGGYLASLTGPGVGSEGGRDPQFKSYRFVCKLCSKPMNTQEDYDRHLKGLKHQMKAAIVSAPDQSSVPLIRREEFSMEKADKCCNTTPRTYQVELMRKAMNSDSTVIYLPTGTGKTLAAMMTLSRMLTLNPTRPVLFLVDKVLLVLQQARYIMNELVNNRTFNRSHLTEDGKLADRSLKVAVLCGGLSVRDGTPLWKHDVIVTTAAFCQNLLQMKVLRWTSFSLVVLDEAHHCTKNHPYNKLLSEHHLSLPPQSRPKILGLTASPAGRRTKEETLTMLKELLENLGGATIATIEEKAAKEELDRYSSSARLVPVCVPMTEAEARFHERLLSYFICAYVELMRCSNLQHICCRKLQNLMASAPPRPADIKQFAQHLISEPDELSEMVQLAQTARMKPNVVTADRFYSIRMHVMTVGMTLLNSEDGIDFVLDDLERLFNPDYNTYFHQLAELGLPCREIATYVNTLCDSAKFRSSEGGGEMGGEGGEKGGSGSMSIFQELLCTLANPELMTWDGDAAMALVLVRERQVAHKFKGHLKRTSFVRQRGMRVAVVVGHGAGGGEGEGMNLRKQDRVLQGIKQHAYGIVVATSVAEEGVDIPECQLVVCLNPPTTVKALVQMRGRARKKDSYFVVLCSSHREKEKLEDLQKQELNMKWAVTQLTQDSGLGDVRQVDFTQFTGDSGLNNVQQGDITQFTGNSGLNDVHQGDITQFTADSGLNNVQQGDITQFTQDSGLNDVQQGDITHFTADSGLNDVQQGDITQFTQDSGLNDVQQGDITQFTGDSGLNDV